MVGGVKRALEGQSSCSPNKKRKIKNGYFPTVLSLILGTAISSDTMQARARKYWWNEFAEKITDPGIKWFGVKAWEKLGFPIKIEDAPPPPLRVVEKVKFLRERFKVPLCFPMLIPKGLTRQILLEKMKEKGIKIGYINQVFLKVDKPVEEPYWIVATGGIEESFRMTPEEQVKLVDEKTRPEEGVKSEYRLLTPLEMFVFYAMSVLSDKKHFFGERAYCYLRCQQEEGQDRPLEIGGGASGGLSVYYDDFVHDDDGVAACGEFP